MSSMPTSVTLRPGSARGLTDAGWLHSRHSFSFGHFRDPARMNFRSLRVLNDDIVAPGGGFPEHAHADMEIITWVLSGSLRHADSTGRAGVLRPGDAQVMSAGAGIRHSEMNASRDEPVHFLQIWITPDRPGHPPRYEQRSFDPRLRAGVWQLIAGPGDDAGIPIHQDARVSVATLQPGHRITFGVSSGRFGYVHIARGAVLVEGQRLQAGDAATIDGAGEVSFVAQAESELMGFDLA